MPTIPFFKHATLREIIITRLCCGADAVVILCCAVYLVGCYHAVGLRWHWLIVALLVGYFLADLFSGLVHWVVDTWLDAGMLGRGIAMTREHHTHPSHVLLYEFFDQASLGAAPSAVVVGSAAAVTALFPVSALTYGLMIVWFVIATCMLFGMSFHNLAHWPVRPPLLRVAQRLHLVCSPEHHWRHHREHTIRYCVINGWANCPCDRLRLWSRLEWLVTATTGRAPRADDAEWQRKLNDTGIFVGSPRPVG
jgi:ubiquitin-conjugating enzyme E2 variant